MEKRGCACVMDHDRCVPGLCQRDTCSMYLRLGLQVVAHRALAKGQLMEVYCSP